MVMLQRGPLFAFGLSSTKVEPLAATQGPMRGYTRHMPVAAGITIRIAAT